MPIAHHRYHPAGPVLVRSSTYPGGQTGPALADPTATVTESLTWLAATWAYPGLAEAITFASPSLAARVTELVHTDRAIPPQSSRRAVSAVSSYLARWQRRATPFGLFAGIGTAAVGPVTARFGERHRVLLRADADWLGYVIDTLEQQKNLRSRLWVVADNSIVARGDRIFVARRPAPGHTTPGPIQETSTRCTRIVRSVLAAAAQPVPFADLAGRLTEDLRADRARIEALLHGLIDGHFLITNLRPPMTSPDGLAHVLGTLEAAGAVGVPETAMLYVHLVEIHALLTQHNTSNDPEVPPAIRALACQYMTRIVPTARHALAADVRLDADITLPAAVLEEAARAAELLLRLSTKPFGHQEWVDYQVRFRNRYGPGALVPLLDLVADSGLGYPNGYLGAPKARPTWRTLTERDVHLLGLIQQAMLDRADEIVLSEVDIEALTVGDHTATVAPALIELGISVQATSSQALDRGDFEIRITGAPRTPTSMIGRFAHLLDPADHEALTRTYTATAHRDAPEIAVQVSFPPRRVHNQNVVRVSRLLPDVVSVAEHPDSETISLDDLAATADAEQLYLVRRSTGQRITAHIPHALDVIVQTPPLARFLAEITDARSAAFGPFDLGAAGRTLPHTPRIRHGRTVLSPARWLITTSDLDPELGTDAEQWDKAVQRWRQRWRVPARVIACHEELRLPLDLDHAGDRALLRTRLRRAGRLEVREDAPEGGWITRPTELLIPLLSNRLPRPLPHTAAAGLTLRPGHSLIVNARLAGNPARFDLLLRTHLPEFMNRLAKLPLSRWWVRRHRDVARPEAEEHLALLVRLTDSAAFGEVTARFATFAAELHDQGLPAELSLASYHEHPGRYGDGPALVAAEHVFATDTQAAIAQLRMAEQTGIATQALAAVSMAQLAASFGPDPTTGYDRLLRQLNKHQEPVDRELSDITRHLADPSDAFLNLRTLAGGDEVVTAWAARNTALRQYHDQLLAQRNPAGVLRTLLHEHHVRAVGIDADFERRTGHLARAAAMRGLAAVGPR
jgi:thiopeptide-type bacteriocin biosynthesis protein